MAARAAIVEQLFRHSAGRIVATLARVLGPARLDVAEEAVQEAMVRALQRWPYAGVPDNPAGWLYQVARNTAVDLVRHDEVVRAKLPLLAIAGDGEEEPGDDELALMFLCCHPGLPLASQVVLTLQTVGGLGVDEIGAALLSRPAAVAQRLVRAKRWLRRQRRAARGARRLACGQRARRAVPALQRRVRRRGGGQRGPRRTVRRGDPALPAAACRPPDGPAADPRAARADVVAGQPVARPAPTRGGDILLLADQDRARWDRSMITEGTRLFGSSCTGGERSTYHVEAAIALCHAMAPDVEHTDWARIVTLYDDLKPSPVAALNRAIAAAMAGEPDHRELARLEREPALRDYHLLPAALGALRLRAGDPAAAAGYYREALTKQVSAPTRRFLERKLDRCLNHPAG